MVKPIAFLFILLLTTPSHAKSIVVGGFDIEPFYFSDGTKGIQGACFEVLEKICALEQLTCKFKIMPFRTALENLKEGTIDVMCPLADSTPRRSAYYFSADVFATAYGLYGLEKNIRNIKHYEDLIGKSISVFGPSNTEVSLQKINEFLNHKIKINMVPSVSKAMKNANANQSDLAYSNIDAAGTWIQRNRSALHEVPNLRDYTGYRIAFSKKTVSKEIYEKFQERIKELKQSKEFESQIEKYKVDLAD
jgi:ABC-type amino acid transport/signal transduction systems, periplasmic component/domain